MGCEIIVRLPNHMIRRTPAQSRDDIEGAARSLLIDLGLDGAAADVVVTATVEWHSVHDTARFESLCRILLSDELEESGERP